MGVPTISMLGDRLISRQGASLLTAAGMGDWVSGSKEEYVRKALIFSSDLNRLAKIRSELRKNVTTSPLFDGPLFAKNFEEALFDIWQKKSKEIIAKTNVAKSKNLETPFEEVCDSDDQTDCIVISATRLTKEEFIRRAIEIHGDFYGYDDVDELDCWAVDDIWIDDKANFEKYKMKWSKDVWIITHWQPLPEIISEKMKKTI
jgi:hypothetical protein